MTRMIQILLLLVGAPALAEPAMSGAEFDAFTMGKSLTYTSDGQIYGVEKYRKNRHVTWAFTGDDCQDGQWYEPEPTQICFLYDTAPGDPQCWHFQRDGDGLRATFIGPDSDRVLYGAQQSGKPLQCLGPKIGV